MEDFVTFEMAKKLKTKGFSCQYPFAMYNEKGVFHECYTSVGNMQYYDYDDFDKYDYIAPTISQVLKWLREEKKYYVSVTYVGKIEDSSDFYYPTIQIVGEFDKTIFTNGNDSFDNYEEAVLTGIEYTLDNLII